MSNRPFFKSSIADLEKIVEENLHKEEVLENVKNELGYRKSLRAQGLKLIVEQKLEEIRGTSDKKDGPKTDPIGEDSTSSSGSNKTKNARNTPNSKTSAAFEESSDLITNFINSLKIETDEIKKSSFSSTIDVRNGKKIKESIDTYLYQFSNTDDVTINDDTLIVITIGGREINGTIISTANKLFIISVEEDFGEVIAFAQIKTDNSFLVDRLRERYEEIRKGEKGENFNLKMTQKVMGEKAPETKKVADLTISQNGLNPKQWDAVKTATAHEVIYLWGPPGTGKTLTLAKIIEVFYSSKRKILIVSNTNLAVDTLLEKLCDVLHPIDSDFERGSVLRYGNIVKPELKERYGTYVDIDLAVERLGQDLKTRKENIEKEIFALKSGIAPLQGILDAFDTFERLQREIKDNENHLRSLNDKKDQQDINLTDTTKKVAKLQQDLETAEKSGAIKRFFKGLDPEKIKSHIEQNQTYKSQIENELKALSGKVTQLKSQDRDLRNRLEPVRRKIQNQNKIQTQKAIEGYKAKLSKLSSLLKEIDERINSLKDEVIKNCRVLAATATQTYLKPSSFSSFATIVVDEASMLPLPVVGYVAGLGTINIVIAGDFRQLPPIVISKHQAVKRWVGQDVFTKAGIVETVKSNKNLSYLVKLKTQYRMLPEICRLINPLFYDGDLKTAPEIETSKLEGKYPDIISNPLTLVNTSGLYPFANIKPRSFSRYNILHAVAIRNLAFYLKKEGVIRTTSNVGIVTPYSAQAEFMNKICTEIGLNEVETGTVHRFQGNEKDVIIFDITDSHGLSYLSRFVRCDSLNDDGSKLINVALSRPRNRLVVFANVPYLEANLPAAAYLRQVLFDIQNSGQVIPIEDIIKLGPYDFPTDTTNSSDTDLSYDPGTTRFFSEGDFDSAFQRDLHYAKKVIVVYSAFITLNRVGFLSDIFRKKMSEGVKIRIITRPPKNQGNIPIQRVSETLSLMIGLGVTVDLRYSIHEKLCFIDDEILWHGSLNLLSHTGRTDESMLRIVSKEACRMKAKFEAYRLNRFKKDATTIEILSEQENPQCQDCGGITVFHTRGRHGPYFRCAAECGWSASLDRAYRDSASDKRYRNNKSSDKTNESAKTCSECGKPMAMRKGRYGEFWGCSEFPNCRNTEKA